MSEVEGLGDVATGAVLGRAVEPKAGEADGHTHERACLNCGCALVGDYCHCCGQKAHVHRTLAAWWHDFRHSVLHLDGKFWRTLPMLAFKPGDLTRRYAHGERAKFISPLALFLFAVFLMFAVMSLTGGTFGELPEAAKADLAAEQRASEAQLGRLQAARTQAEASGRPTAAIDVRIADLRDEIASVEALRRGDFSRRAVENSEGLPGWLNDSIGKAAANPELLAYKVKANAYKFSWALIPISVPFVWLLFPLSRRFTLYDHTVFVTYSLAFMTMLVVATVLLGEIGLAGVIGLAWLVPPVHMFLQLKGAYGLTVASALWRTVLLTLFALLALTLFVVALLAIGVL